MEEIINNPYRNNFRVGKSNIHGNGVIANKNIKKDQIIAVPIMFNILIIPHVTTDFGKWINHSYNANSYLYYNLWKNVYFLIAKKDIVKDEEISSNYNNTPWFIKKPEPFYL